MYRRRQNDSCGDYGKDDNAEMITESITDGFKSRYCLLIYFFFSKIAELLVSIEFLFLEINRLAF